MPDLPRVLVYRDFLLPASETFIKNQAEGLRRFVPYYAGLRVIDGIALPPDRVVTFQSGGALGKVQNAVFRFTGIPVTAIGRLLRLRARLLHAHFGTDATRVMSLASALRVPLLVTLHDYDVTTSDEDLRRLAPYCATYIARRPRLARRADAFIAVSEFLRRRAIARGFPAEKIEVHYIGIDVDRFNPAARRIPDRPTVLFVGRLAPKKGCRFLIEAMSAVQAVEPDAELVVVGAGALRAELEAQASATLTRYRFIGSQTSEQVHEWYTRAAVFCAPSVTAETGETEGLPITVLEAQAMGLPVVSTRHAGIPEAVIHERTGLLADERDPTTLARHILALLANPGLAAALGAAARASVCDRFNLQTQNARLEDIYDRLIRARRSGGQSASSSPPASPR